MGTLHYHPAQMQRHKPQRQEGGVLAEEKNTQKTFVNRHTDRSRDCDFPRDGIGMFHQCLAQTQRQEGESDVVQTFLRSSLSDQLCSECTNSVHSPSFPQLHPSPTFTDPVSPRDISPSQANLERSAHIHHRINAMSHAVLSTVSHFFHVNCKRNPADYLTKFHGF